MKSRSVIFAILGVLLVPFIYGSSSSLHACADIRHDGYDNGVCSGNKVADQGETCCWKLGGALEGYTMCQTCKIETDEKGSYERCGPATVQDLKLPTGQSGPSGGVLENPTTLGPNFGQKFEGVLQAENNLTFSQANISSGNTSSDILSLGQSDLASGMQENTSKSVGIGEEEKNEDGTTGETIEETEDDKNGDNGDEDKDDEDEEQPQG